MKTPSKTPIVVSVVLTVILLLLLTAFAFFMQIIIMNGVISSRQTNIALGTTFGCQGLEVILGAILAGRLTRFFLDRFQMNRVLAVIFSVVAVLVLAAVLSVISIFVGLIAAGIV
ncbi:MAG: hypothetical protein ACOYZ6_16635 [Chloroflexota bacterium]